MKASRSLFLDFRNTADDAQFRRMPAWLPGSVLALMFVLLLAAFPPRLADLCDQDGLVICGP